MPSNRDARTTIRFVDDYCQLFADLFPDVHSYEAFKYLHLEMISGIERKSLSAISRVVDNKERTYEIGFVSSLFY